MDIQGKKKRSVSYMKQEVRDVLRTKTPDGWARTIKRRIKDPIMRRWMGSIGVWNYPDRKAWGTELDELSSWYRSDLNTNTSYELEVAFAILGWPYRKGASDDKLPSDVHNRDTHNIIQRHRKQKNVHKFVKHHQEEMAG